MSSSVDAGLVPGRKRVGHGHIGVVGVRNRTARWEAGVDWDDLRVLLAVERGGSVSAASGALGVSRSTINRRLAALERATGHVLVERSRAPSGGGLALSEAGGQLIPIARRIEAEALEAERILAGRDVTLEGRVDVTVFEEGGLALAPAFAALHAAHPAIELHVRTTNQTLSLQRRECDVAIRATPAPHPDLFGRRLGTLPFAVYGRPELLDQDQPPWVLWEASVGAEATWSLARSLCDPLDVAAVVDTAPLMHALVASGAGVALLPVDVGAALPGVVPWGPVPRPGLGMDVWVLAHRDLRRTPRVRTVLSFVAAHVPASWRAGDASTTT